jgi:hypothetical protein
MLRLSMLRYIKEMIILWGTLTTVMPRPSRSDDAVLGKIALRELLVRTGSRESRRLRTPPSTTCRLKLYSYIVVYMKHFHSTWVFHAASFRGGCANDRPLSFACI